MPKIKPNKVYLEWLHSKNIDDKTKNEIKKYTQEEVDLFFTKEHMHFGTAGIRGLIGPGTTKMNKFTYAQFCIGYAKYLKKHFPRNTSVVIGHDNRMFSDIYSMVCADVMTSFGIKVYLFEKNHLTPTPIISYCIRQLKTSGGIIVTASHNPKNYNGYKIYNPDGGQILPDVAAEVESYLPSCVGLTKIKYKPNKKLIKYIPEKLVDKYFKDVQKALVHKSFVNKTKKWPVIVTCHHGTASKYLPKFLKSLHFNVIPVKEQCFFDPKFSNSPSSNPEAFNSFELSIKYANKYKANICIGVDPDADRMAVLLKHNGKWRLMTGNDMGILYTYFNLANRKYKKTPFIAASYVSTGYIDKIAKAYKAKVYRTGTGFKYMGAIMTKCQDTQSFVVAFEEAIGACNTDINRDKDCFSASLAALEIYDYCLNKKMDLIDYLEKVIFKKFGAWFGATDSFIITKLNWQPVAETKMNYFKNYKSKTFNGLKINKVQWNKVGGCLEWLMDNGDWIKFRKSGTEPKFKVYYNFNGSTLPALRKKYEDLHKAFDKIITK
ncbi:MAG: phospho-sugar mutase [Malacoplasma sp.]|nr:phospho-sugar mutase [Malacoplasma sp.]